MAREDIDRELEELARRSGADEGSSAEDFETTVVAPDREVDEEREAAAEAASEAAFAGQAELPSSGLLSFYDGLRPRLVKAVERRGGRLGATAVKALLLVPDVFILLVRILLDPEVPGSARALVGGALAYFVLPLDLMPEAVVGGAGYVEDLVLAVAVLAHTFTGDLEPFARKHWSGPEDLRVVIGDITSAAQGLLGANLYGRVQRVLARRGVELEEPADEEAGAEPTVH